MTLIATRAPARTAALRAATAGDGDGSASFDPDDGPWIFSGIAVGPGDILHKPDGEPVLFTAANLEAAAHTQEGEPLTADHPSDEDGTPRYPPDTDETEGKVRRADFIPGKGLGYEAVLTNPDLAEGIHAGVYEVSVHAAFDLGDRDPETGVKVAENIEFRDLSVVSRGDSPANTAEWGPSQELAAWATDHDVSTVLAGATHTPDYSATSSDREWERPSFEDFETDDPGDVTDHFLATSADSFDAVDEYGSLKLPVVAADGTLVLGGLDSAHQMAGQTDGLTEDDVSSARATAERLADEEFDVTLGGEADDDDGGEAEGATPTPEAAGNGPLARLQAAAEDVSRMLRGAIDAPEQDLSTAAPTENESAESDADTASPDTSGDTDDSQTNSMSDTDPSDNPEGDAGEGGDTESAATADVDLGEHDSLDAKIEAAVEEALTETVSETVADELESQIKDQIEAERTQRQKADLVDEIIANDDGFEDTEDTRADLLATDEAVLERLHEQATATAKAPQIPGSLGGGAGGRQALAANDGDASDFEGVVAAARGEETAPEQGGDD